MELEKIRNLDKTTVSQGLSMLFTRIANLSGIKDPISQFNKTDIAEMILMRFKGLSLEEIDYAFKLERYGVYSSKTKHYQLFDADYVSTVLEKYKQWLKQTRVENNIPIAITTTQNQQKELTPKEKETVLKLGLERVYHEYKTFKTIPVGVNYLYNYLFDKKEINPTADYRKKTRQQAISNLNPTHKNEILKALDALNGKSNRKPKEEAIQNECKRIALKDYFDNLIKKERCNQNP